MKRSARHLLGAISLILLLATSCSGASDADSADPTSDTVDPTSAASDDPDSEDSDSDNADPDAADTDDSDTEDSVTDGDDPDTDDPDSASATAEPTAEPTLADDEIEAVVDGVLGDRFEDESGNQLAVRALEAWPASFGQLPDDTRGSFPFVDAYAAASGPGTSLWSMDIAVCAAGIGSEDSGGDGEFGDFSLVDSVDAPLEMGESVGLPRPAGNPARYPGVSLPDSGQCDRGWLAVLWSGDEPPAFVRYVLTLPPAGADSDDAARFVYHWDLAVPPGSDDDPEVGGIEPLQEPFDAGQTVTFTAGDLAESTVTVQGWAEQIDVASEFAGTRSVAVALEVCPGAEALPEFGLAVDGWNLVMPLPGQPLQIDPDTGCFDGWLDFAVPFGGVPTGFFASDGESGLDGYAEWTLVGAAIAESP